MVFDTSDKLELIPEPLTEELVIEAMQRCEQFPGQTVWQHGESVQSHLLELLSYLRENTTINEKKWYIPDWALIYREKILANLAPIGILMDYTLYHDAGKPFCREIDKEGKQHFPNHAQVSAQILGKIAKNCAVCQLVRDDMDIHILNSEQINSKMQMWSSVHAITLLMTALAEIHANAELFGGIQSISFKIKLKTLKKRGLQICKHYFGNESG